MRLYEGGIQQFKDDVIQNRIEDILTTNFQQLIGRKPSPSERRSWVNSLNQLKNVFDFSQLKDNQLTIEYQLPYSEKRIDAIVFGRNLQNVDNMVVIELKQWTNDNVSDSQYEGNVLVDFGRRVEELAHPSLQVEGYHNYLKDFVSAFEEKPPLFLNSCVYCHNYSKQLDAVLYLPKFENALARYPLFSKEDVKLLSEYLKKWLQKGDGLEVFNRFIRSPLRPSKKLLEHTREMIDKQQIFNLIDDQIPPKNAIMHKAKHLTKSKKKSVIIVKGGPGTGKSVIALEVMGELMRQKRNVYHATGSSAFTNTLRKILGTRSANFFKFFNSFTRHEESEIDVLICDEAHRIRKTSESRYTPRHLRTDTPQIEELIKAARLSIFFIDEYQVVRPNEIGSVKLIKETAREWGVEDSEIAEFELRTQFRCSGSDSYLQWLDNIFGIRPSEKQTLIKEDKMEFKIFDSPIKLKEAIDEKNREKKNSGRLAAGFCWPWSNPRRDGTLVNDVVIGDFKMPWEQKNQFWRWATDDSGMEQVGTVYTAQGFEFDYMGVIFGNDLVYDWKRQKWIAKPENSHDTMAKRNNPQFVKHLKQVYRVLMSRAHKGCYVCFMDKDTEKLFKSKIEFDPSP